MKEVLIYSLCPFPCSLATNEGDLVKTVKSKLLSTVEEEVHIPIGEKAYIVDRMAMLQTIKEVPDTFGALATRLLAKVVNIVISFCSKRLDFVCDRYPAKFISLGQNKEELMKFIFTTWRKADPGLLKGVEVFIVAGMLGIQEPFQTVKVHVLNNEIETFQSTLSRNLNRSNSKFTIPGEGI
jgi:hypothetical protein